MAENPNALALQAQVKSLKDTLTNPDGNLAKLLPRGWDHNRYAAMCMGAIMREPKLLQCDRTALLGAFFQCASMGWSLDPALGHAFINPREISVRTTGKDGVEVVRKELQPVLQPEYRGLQTVICRNPNVRAVVAQLVYANDKFEMDFADPLHPIKFHKPPLTGPRGEVLGGYGAIINHDGGFAYFEWMDRDHLDQIRTMDVSKSSAWKSANSTVVDEMYRKTLVRRVCKHGDMQDPEITRALELVGLAEAGKPQNLAAMADENAEWQVADSMTEGTEAAGESAAGMADRAAQEMSAPAAADDGAPPKLSQSQSAHLMDVIETAVRPHTEAKSRAKAMNKIVEALAEEFGDPLPPSKLTEMEAWARAYVARLVAQKDTGGAS